MDFDLTVPDPRRWSIGTSAVFCRVKELHGDLSNMANGMPLTVIWKKGNQEHELIFGSSESLYQSLAFDHEPEYISDIQSATTGYVSKLVAYKYLDKRKAHWDKIKIPAMAFALTAKQLQSTRFQDALKVTGTQEIVELSKRDNFWGACPSYGGTTLYGRNTLGRLLVQLRNGARLISFEDWFLPI